MDLPAALLRMLDVSCINDQLKNWSIYQEKDGCYTFKIRFSPSNSRHIEDIPAPPNRNLSFKCKSRKQFDRDLNRNKAFQEKRVTRSQTAKKNSGVSDQVDTDRRPPNPESPIETFRHASSTSTAFNIDSPVFVPNSSIHTTSDVANSDLEVNSSSKRTYCSPFTVCNSCKKFVAPGICHPFCTFGSCNDGIKNPDVKCYYCPQCDMSVCQNCLDSGGHTCHKDFLELE